MSLKPKLNECAVSVVMPCLNEERTIGICIDKARAGLETLGCGYEVIVADNGSHDHSVKIALEHGARVIKVVNRGYGSALRGGIESARAPFIIMGDGDDSYDFSHVGRFVSELEKGADIVMGNRFRGGIFPGAMPFLHRYLGNPVLTGILNLFFRTRIGDAHCGLRGFRKDSYQKLRLSTTGMEFASEMIVKAALHRQKIAEVPTTLKPDGRDRPPHLRTWRDGWRHLRFLLLMSPTWLYLVPALLCMAAGLTLMVRLSFGPIFFGDFGLDINTMLAGAALVLIGYQIFWLWSYARIYGWRSGILPADAFSARTFQVFNLERGLGAGLSLLCVGIGVFLTLFFEWSARGFGALDSSASARFALWGLLFLTVGSQTMFSSFFLSMLGIDTSPEQTVIRFTEVHSQDVTPAKKSA